MIVQIGLLFKYSNPISDECFLLILTIKSCFHRVVNKKQLLSHPNAKFKRQELLCSYNVNKTIAY